MSKSDWQTKTTQRTDGSEVVEIYRARLDGMVDVVVDHKGRVGVEHPTTIGRMAYPFASEAAARAAAAKAM